jgi:DNA-binding MarR family transcriptional regulator
MASNPEVETSNPESDELVIPDEAVTPDEAVIPALLRAARGSYAHAIRARLVAEGFDDMPRNGSYVVGGIVNQGGSAENLVEELGISEQAASQLIDTLVLRGYLERQADAEDPRRVSIEVTDRGRAAAAVVRAGVQAIDEELAGLVLPNELAGLRAGLVALCDIRERMEDEARAGVGDGS